MFDQPEWQAANQDYLALAMTWVREILASSGGGLDGEPNNERLAQLNQQLEERGASEFPPAIQMLKNVFGLSTFECQILLLCVAAEFDTGMLGAFAAAHGNTHMTYPTFSLAMSLCAQPSWEVVAPDRPLRFWNLIRFSAGDDAPLISRRLFPDERIVNLLKGLSHIDARLIPLLKSRHAVSRQLPESHSHIADQLEESIQARLSVGSPDQLTIRLSGTDADGKRDIVDEVSRRFGLQQYELKTTMLPSNSGELWELAKLWRREACLTPVCLFVPDNIDEAPSFGRSLESFLSASQALAFVESAGPELSGTNAPVSRYQ